jgi:protein involved in polysaccharide export with SLBB domain
MSKVRTTAQFALVALALASAAANAQTTQRPPTPPPTQPSTGTAPTIAVPPSIQAATGLTSAPTAAQVSAILQSNPNLAATLRTKISQSGLTADQVRARLRNAGYPDNLLDSYLNPSDTSSATPSPTVMNAVQFLGFVDQQQQDSLAKLAALQAAIATQAPPSPIYGLDIFRRSTNQFQPDLAGPVDASYKLGPHDVLALILTGGVETSYTLEVTREGFVVVPQVGQIYVANLTLDQATTALYQRMKSVYSRLGTGPSAGTKLFVTVARLRVNQVFVIGDVMAPGSYQISGAGTMLTALYGAGGPTENGSLRDVQLRRGGKVISRFDLYRYLTSGEASSDFRVETGDVVFVPVHGPRVQIFGEVVRPAVYELAPNETLEQLIYLAGGFTASADARRVLIRRIVPPEERTVGGRDRTVMDVALHPGDGDGGGAGGIALENGDEVDVNPISTKVRNSIAVAGAVWNPADIGFRPGMMLSEALRIAGGVRPDVQGVQINRLQSDQNRRELRAQFRDSLGTLVHDIPLQEDDSITVFGTADFRPDRYVQINGAVKNNGRFPYREGMTLRDLLHYAGGLADGAFLGRAEIARVPADRTAGMLASTIAVPMDSTYVLERGVDGKYAGPPGLSAPASGAPEVELKPYDHVLILRQPDWQTPRTVQVLGEVQFPGTYVLNSRGEKLSDVVRRAGGLTSQAYPEGASLYRKLDNVGRITVDVSRALKDTTFRENVILQDQDSLFVPPYKAVVDVRGAVNSPIAVAYNPGKNLRYYIDAAGGMAYTGDWGRAYVQQPSGVVQPQKVRHFMLDEVPTPLPGSVVFVPLVDPNSRKDWGQIVGSIAQVTTSVLAMIVIISRVK